MGDEEKYQSHLEIQRVEISRLELEGIDKKLQEEAQTKNAKEIEEELKYAREVEEQIKYATETEEEIKHASEIEEQIKHVTETQEETKHTQGVEETKHIQAVEQEIKAIRNIEKPKTTVEIQGDEDNSQNKSDLNTMTFLDFILEFLDKETGKKSIEYFKKVVAYLIEVSQKYFTKVRPYLKKISRTQMLLIGGGIFYFIFVVATIINLPKNTNDSANYNNQEEVPYATAYEHETYDDLSDEATKEVVSEPVVQKDENDEITSFLSFKYEDDVYGKLYYNYEGSSTLVGEQVNNKLFLLGPKTGVVVYDTINGLFIKNKDEIAYQVLEKRNLEDLTLTEDEAYLIIGETEGNYSIYNILEDNLRTVMYNGYNSYVDQVNNTFYYLTREGILERISNFDEEEELLAEVSDYKVLSPNLIIFSRKQEGGEQYYLWQKGVQKSQEIDIEHLYLESAKETQDKKAVFFEGNVEQNPNNTKKELFIMPSGARPISLSRDVQEWEYSEERGTLYYTDRKHNLFCMEVSKNGCSYNRQLMAKDIKKFKVNEYNIVVLTNTQQLYVYNEEKRMLVDGQVELYELAGDTLIYSRTTKALYVLGEVSSRAEAVTSEDKEIISQEITMGVLDASKTYLFCLESNNTQEGSPSFQLVRYDLYHGEKAYINKSIDDFDSILISGCKLYTLVSSNKKVNAK